MIKGEGKENTVADTFQTGFSVSSASNIISGNKPRHCKWAEQEKNEATETISCQILASVQI